MAERRMFSLKIINSAKFLKMPIEVQTLYFHLGLRADDDGVVEAWSIMRMIGASDDSLKVLHAKGFIVILNDDYVSFITDWHEHNKIRADRKIDSIYKKLLVQFLPEVKLLEPRQRADRKKNKDNVGTSHGQPMDNYGTTNGQHRLGKDRLGKDRLGKVSVDKEQKEPAHTEKQQKKPEKINYSEYVFLTEDEYKKLCEKYSESGATRIIEILNNYKGSSGKKYKSDYLAILHWVVDRFAQEVKKQNTQSYQKQTPIDILGEMYQEASEREEKK